MLPSGAMFTADSIPLDQQVFYYTRMPRLLPFFLVTVPVNFTDENDTFNAWKTFHVYFKACDDNKALFINPLSLAMKNIVTIWLSDYNKKFTKK